MVERPAVGGFIGRRSSTLPEKNLPRTLKLDLRSINIIHTRLLYVLRLIPAAAAGGGITQWHHVKDLCSWASRQTDRPGLTGCMGLRAQPSCGRVTVCQQRSTRLYPNPSLQRPQREKRAERTALPTLLMVHGDVKEVKMKANLVRGQKGQKPEARVKQGE